MLPSAATTILACFAAAPGFKHLNGAIEKLGFKETGQQNQDVRWGNAEGVEVFLSSIPGQTVCSVWFNGSLADEIVEVPKLLQNNGYAMRDISDQSGPLWLVGTNWFLRLVVKQGDESRLGAALFVLRN